MLTKQRRSSDGNMKGQKRGASAASRGFVLFFSFYVAILWRAAGPKGTMTPDCIFASVNPRNRKTFVFPSLSFGTFLPALIAGLRKPLTPTLLPNLPPTPFCDFLPPRNFLPSTIFPYRSHFHHCPSLFTHPSANH